jgi:hypothetical protein
LEEISSLIALSSSESSNGFDNTLSAWDSAANASGYSPHPVVAITGVSFYFLNLLRPITARLTKPDPSITSVMGSEIWKALSPFEVSSSTLGFVATLDVAAFGAGSLGEGQPIKPKNIITIQKNINNFFILPHS